MALRNEEITRLKFELGYNVTGVGAEPYITYQAVFDKAVQPYLIDLGSTSSTTVVAVDGGAVTTIYIAANPVSPSSTQALTFVSGSSIVVDVGPSQEDATVQYVNGLAITVNLCKAHTGTYPVLIQGAERIVRDLFLRLDTLKDQIANIAPITAGVERSDEISLYGGGVNNRRGRSKFEDLIHQRTVARRDLAAAVGVPYLTDIRRGAGAGFEVY